MPTHPGAIRRPPRFRAARLGNARAVLVYHPPGYRRARLRYPVLYLQDGQNCFDADTAYGGTEWGADETAERLINTGEIEPLIMVAVANLGADRIHEYAPTAGVFETTRDGERRSRGHARRYGRFLIKELKPFIDAHYRTRPGPEDTGLGGSSMGGLVTLSLGLWFPRVFTRLAVCSPSAWWDDGVLYKMVDALKRKLDLKIWLDMGTAEPGWGRARILRDCLLEKGWRADQDLRYLEVPGAHHTESAWAARFDQVLKFLFPRGGPTLGEKR